MFSILQRQALVSAYERYKDNDTYRLVCVEFRGQFPDVTPPSRMGLYKLWKKWTEKKTLLDLRKGHVGRKYSKNVAENQQFGSIYWIC